MRLTARTTTSPIRRNRHLGWDGWRESSRPELLRVVIEELPRLVESSPLEHFVGSGQECLGHRQPEGLGGLLVDDHLEFCGLLDGKISRLGSLKDLVDVDRSLPELGRKAGLESAATRSAITCFPSRSSPPHRHPRASTPGGFLIVCNERATNQEKHFTS